MSPMELGDATEHERHDKNAVNRKLSDGPRGIHPSRAKAHIRGETCEAAREQQRRTAESGFVAPDEDRQHEKPHELEGPQALPGIDEPLPVLAHRTTRRSKEKIEAIWHRDRLRQCGVRGPLPEV